MPAGPPHPPENCSVITVSAVGFTLACLPGFDGGHPQRFVMSVWQQASSGGAAGSTSPDPTAPADGTRLMMTKSLVVASQSGGGKNLVEPAIQEAPFPEWIEKGLQPARDYRLKIVARNEAGSSQPVFLALKTLKVEEAPSALSPTVVAAIAGSLGGFAFLVLTAIVAYLCVRRRKKGECKSSRETPETYT